MGKLHVGGPGPNRPGRDPNFNKNLLRLEGSGEKSLEEVVHLDGALALGPLRYQFGPQGDDGGRVVGGGVGVGQAPADRPHGPALRSADRAGGRAQERALLLQERRGLHGVVGRQRPDGDGPAVLLDSGEPRNLSEIDEGLGLGQAELHHGEQAVTAGQDFRVILEPAQEGDRLLDAGWAVVIELGRIHGDPPFTSWRPSRPARFWMASEAWRYGAHRTGPGHPSPPWRWP